MIERDHLAWAFAALQVVAFIALLWRTPRADGPEVPTDARCQGIGPGKGSNAMLRKPEA